MALTYPVTPFSRCSPRLRGLLVVLLGLLLLSPLRLGIVTGDSMAPSFGNGAMYVLDRAYYRRQGTIHRGDVVVFSHQGRNYIKRVLAVGGDTVYLVQYPEDPHRELIRTFQLQSMRRALTKRPWRFAFQVVEHRVPAGEVFVVGDHLASSVDSRQFGSVPMAEVRGKVLFAPPAREMLEEFAGNFRPSRPS